MSLTAKLAAHFRAFPNLWHDGRGLSHIAGYAAYRTRISDLRRAPWMMRIENEVTHTTLRDGSRFKVSKYRFVPGNHGSVGVDDDTPRGVDSGLISHHSIHPIQFGGSVKCGSCLAAELEAGSEPARCHHENGEGGNIAAGSQPEAVPCRPAEEPSSLLILGG